jgi:hypothetical protein
MTADDIPCSNLGPLKRRFEKKLQPRLRSGLLFAALAGAAVERPFD